MVHKNTFMLVNGLEVYWQTQLMDTAPSLSVYEADDRWVWRIQVGEKPPCYLDMPVGAVSGFVVATELSALTLDSSLGDEAFALRIADEGFIKSLEVLCNITVDAQAETSVIGPGLSKALEEMTLLPDDAIHLNLPQPAPSDAVKQKQTAPKGALDLKAETISPLCGRLEYTLDDWQTCQTVTLEKGVFHISDLFSPSERLTLKIRKKEDSLLEASPSLSIALPKRPAATNGMIHFLGEAIKGLNEKTEYSLDGFQTITQVKLTYGGLSISSFISDTEPVTIQIRKMKTLAAPAGEIQTLILPPRPAAPQGVLDPDAKTISGLEKGLEYSMDGFRNKKKVSLKNNVMNVASLYSRNKTRTLSIRTPATKESFSGASQVFTLE